MIGQEESSSSDGHQGDMPHEKTMFGEQHNTQKANNQNVRVLQEVKTLT